MSAKKLLLLFFFISFAFSTRAQSDWPAERDTSGLLGKLIFQQYCDSFPEIYMMPEWYKLQLIYVQIDRDSLGVPHFTRHEIGVDDNRYFYPASLVKLPCIMLAMEKLAKLKKYGVNRYTRLKIGAAHSCQYKLEVDTTGPEDYPCLANFFRKILLVSDNNSYNRIYEFLGQDYINNELLSKGYPNALIIKRFSKCSVEENRFTNPFWFYDAFGKLLYTQPMAESKTVRYNKNINATVGKAYFDGKKLINHPMDFTWNNRITLNDALDMMMRFLFPETIDSSKRWHIDPDDRAFLLQYFCMYPRLSPYPKYQNFAEYEDSYKKYFLYGDMEDTIQDNDLKIFNIVGLSYGYSSDICYVVNLRTGVEFMLAGVIYTNKDDILNDDTYEFREVAFPFFSRIGRIIYRMEEQRKKEYYPNFKEIRAALSRPPL